MSAGVAAAGTIRIVTSAVREPVVEIGKKGNKWWRVNGVLHREDGPACELANGATAWFHHGQRHRDDGPAVEYSDGTKEWWLHVQRHCEDGPAIEYPEGAQAWYLHDREYTKSVWLLEALKDRPLTPTQRRLLGALSENWDGTPDLLYETALLLG